MSIYLLNSWWLDHIPSRTHYSSTSCLFFYEILNLLRSTVVIRGRDVSNMDISVYIISNIIIWQITFIWEFCLKNHVEKNYVQIIHFARKNKLTYIFQKVIFLETSLKIACLIKVHNIILCVHHLKGNFTENNFYLKMFSWKSHPEEI